MPIAPARLAAGVFTWMLCEWLRYGKPSALGIATGMVAGLGTITPASGFVGPVGALFIGGAAGIVCFFATSYMKRALRIDDSLDVFPVHGVGGILGTFLTGIFVSTTFGGIGYPEKVTMAEQVGVQLLGIVAVGVWSGVLMLHAVGCMVWGDDGSDESCARRSGPSRIGMGIASATFAPAPVPSRTGSCASSSRRPTAVGARSCRCRARSR